MMKLCVCFAVVGLAASVSLDEKYAPKYDGFEHSSVKGTITMYAKTQSSVKGNLEEIEKKDAESGWAKESKSPAEHEAKLFQDLPLIKQGYTEVQAGQKGFRFRNEAKDKEVYCAEARNEKGFRTKDGAALEFKFNCDELKASDKMKFKSLFYYPYHWNGGGYFYANAGYPWYGGYGEFSKARKRTRAAGNKE
eukprot:g2438.t1